MAKKLKWVVRLGPMEWAPHTYARAKGDDIKLLGSVQRGSQLGALAVTGEGQYLQVVGDYVVPLNRSQILNAVEKATASMHRKTAWTAFRANAQSVVIKVKRSRVPVMPWRWREVESPPWRVLNPPDPSRSLNCPRLELFKTNLRG